MNAKKFLQRQVDTLVESSFFEVYERAGDLLVAEEIRCQKTADLIIFNEPVFGTNFCALHQFYVIEQSCKKNVKNILGYYLTYKEVQHLFDRLVDYNNQTIFLDKA